MDKRRVLAVALLLMLAFGFPVTLAGELKVGDPVPSFRLIGTDGQWYTPEQFKGKKAMVIAWYPKAFTGGWTAECKSLRDSGDALAEYNVALFAISVDDPETNKKFAESLEVNYPLLSDPDKSTAAAFGVLHESGKYALRWTFYVGVDGLIKHIEKQVNTRSHGADVVAMLESLGFPKKE